MMIIIWLLQIILVPAISPLIIGVIKKLKAKAQNRRGAGITQPYFDLWKLFHKDEILSRDSSWLSRYSPAIIFAVTIMVGAGIPLFAAFLNNGIIGDILVLVYTLAVGTFFLALIGLDTGGAFGGFGASREMTMAALAEGGFIFSLLTVALISHGANLFTIAGVGLLGNGQSLLSITLAAIAFFIILLAETARFPFDNPATHLELTMIHEAMILECSGKRLALLEWASANKLVIFAALIANLFAPIGIATGAGLGLIMVGLVALVIKLLIICLIIAGLESVMAKFRFFRLPDLLIISFILSAVAIALIK